MENKENDIMKMVVEDIGRVINKCKSCIHKEVCDKKQNDFEVNCENYKNNLNPKIYGNIYEMFDPIFEWIKIHYPSNEVRFVVDYNSAKMYLEHGVFVFDKQLRTMATENDPARSD